MRDESEDQGQAGRLFAASPLICAVVAWLAAWQVITSGTSGLRGDAGMAALAFATMLAAGIVVIAAVVGAGIGLWLVVRDDARPSTIVGLAVNLLTLLAAAVLWRPQ
jgi:hypothetical protein